MADTIKARILLPAGMAWFDGYFNPVNEFGERAKTLSRPVSSAVLRDPYYSAEAPIDLRLPKTLPETKWEAAKALSEAFGDDFDRHLHDAPLWNWMTLYYADSVLGATPGEGRPVKLLESNVYNIHPRDAAGRVFQFRHRLWGPAFVWNRVGEDARVCLTGPVSTMSDVLDAVNTYNVLSPAVLPTVCAMYYDEETDTLTAPSKSSTRIDGELREGTIRECLAQIAQIAATRAIHLLTPEQILDALPEAEFGRHVEVAKRKLGLLPPAMAA